MHDNQDEATTYKPPPPFKQFLQTQGSVKTATRPGNLLHFAIEAMAQFEIVDQ